MLQKSESLTPRQIKTSKEFRKLFLLQFTKELIKHSGEGEVSELKNILKEESEEKKQEIKKEKKEIHQIITGKKEPFLILKEKFPSKNNLLKPLSRPSITRPRVLRIPEPKLPPRFQYLTPTPTKTEIDLEKLNPLVKDPAVKAIECNGPDENIIVKGTMGTKRTNIILNKEEIDQIIKKFSETAKIPLYEGIFRVVVGKLILSAIISDVIGSKFIIKKMMYSPGFKR